MALAVCTNFKAYQRESDGDQPQPENWPSRDEDEAADIPENEHKEIQEKEDDTPLIDEDVRQSASSLVFPVKHFLG